MEQISGSRPFPSPLNSPVTQSDLTTNIFCVQFWEQCLPWTLKQAEETYCDCVGLRLFGDSYLHAFSYILSPGTEGTRSPYYPNMTTRVQNLLTASAAYGYAAPSGYLNAFADSPTPNLVQSDAFLLSVADQAHDRMVTALVTRADRDVGVTGIAKPTPAEAERILDRFRLVVPAENCHRLSDILVAGWRAYAEDHLWADIPQISERRDRNLKELVLKNIEVFEIEQILSESP